MKTAVGEVQGEALTLVNTTNTAIAAESGSLPVLGTPFMLALMEKATCEAVADLLEDDETTVEHYPHQGQCHWRGNHRQGYTDRGGRAQAYLPCNRPQRQK